MNTRFDICTPRKSKDGKTFWTKIGTAWQSDKGTQLVFDALPLPDSEGRCVANLFEPKPREQAQGNQGGGWTGKAPADDLNDDIPF
jgi:hypothetical protein